MVLCYGIRNTCVVFFTHHFRPYLAGNHFTLALTMDRYLGCASSKNQKANLHNGLKGSKNSISTLCTSGVENTQMQTPCLVGLVPSVVKRITAQLQDSSPSLEYCHLSIARLMSFDSCNWRMPPWVLHCSRKKQARSLPLTR